MKRVLVFIGFLSIISLLIYTLTQKTAHADSKNLQHKPLITTQK